MSGRVLPSKAAPPLAPPAPRPAPCSSQARRGRFLSQGNPAPCPATPPLAPPPCSSQAYGGRFLSPNRKQPFLQKVPVSPSEKWSLETTVWVAGARCHQFVTVSKLCQWTGLGNTRIFKRRKGPGPCFLLRFVAGGFLLRLVDGVRASRAPARPTPEVAAADAGTAPRGRSGAPSSRGAAQRRCPCGSSEPWGASLWDVPSNAAFRRLWKPCILE